MYIQTCLSDMLIGRQKEGVSIMPYSDKRKQLFKKKMLVNEQNVCVM